MFTHASSDAYQPPRKEKSKTGFNTSTDHLIFEVSDSADGRASGAGKNHRKTKPTSSAHRRNGFVDRPAAVRRVEARRAALKNSRGPAPTRGEVKGAIFEDLVDATWGCLCASPTFTRDTDAFLDSVPFPKKSQPMANLWPLVHTVTLPSASRSDADAFLDSVPFPKKSQPMANFWPLMDVPVLRE